MAIAIALPVEKPGAELQVVPVDVRTFPEVPGATNCTADVPLPITMLLAVKVLAPVPPLVTATAPLNWVTPMVLLVNVAVLVAVTTLVGVIIFVRKVI